MNNGFDGIAVKKGEKYDFSVFSKVLDDTKGGKVLVRLTTKDGKEIAQAAIRVSSTEWKKQKAVLTATADAADAVLSVCPQMAGKYALDMVSLFPQNTFKGRKNGLRADLAQTLADLHPRFVRFPGGCVAHGDGVDNIYDWKGSIGALEERKPLRNLWAIIRHVVWDIMNISCSARTWVLNLFPWWQPECLVRTRELAAITR